MRLLLTDTRQRESFAEALDVVESLFGRTLRFGFTKKDVDRLLDEATCYSDEVKERVKTIIYYQMRCYEYLFK